MATTINKQRLLTLLFTAVRKAPDSEEEPRTVLDQVIYGLCREDATPEQADQAFNSLRERFFDWNEVRVSTVRELEESFEGMSHTEARGQRLVSFLQEVFETHFSFDLQNLLKKGLKDAAKQLSRYAATNDYAIGWVTQRSLGGHAIPLDAPTLRCSRRLGLLDDSQDDLEAARASLEHLIPKAKGAQFTDQISIVAEDNCWEEDPACTTCPMASECPTAQDAGVAPSGSTKVRQKPR
jgi:endonuclease III